MTHPEKRPHILIINPDQWRGDVLGHRGNPAALTPVLDRLVETDAVSFTSAFCQNPVCTPSRCSFMTGWYPHVRGHRTMFHMLHPDEPNLLRDLKEAGYFVWWGGKNDLVPGQLGFADVCDVCHRTRARPDRPVFPNPHAWNEWRGAPGSDTYYSFYYGKIEKPENFPPEEDFVYDGDWDTVFGAIDAIRSRPADRPICLFLALGYPHPPYAVEDPWYSAVQRDKLPERAPTPPGWQGKPGILKGIWQNQGLQDWTEERWDELRATYYGSCARVDSQVGLLLDALKEAGIYADTAVFVFSDHGDFTGDYGLVEKTQNTFEDCLTNVPFLIKPPAGVACRPGTRDALIELVDFRATVEELTGLHPGYTHFGRSLLPLLAGQTTAHRDAVFCEGGRLDGETHCAELESTAHQVPEGLYYPRLSLQRGVPEHTKAVMLRTREYKYVRRLYETDELYDLRADPREMHNRIADPALSAVLAQLKERLLTFYLETADVVPWQADRRE